MMKKIILPLIALTLMFSCLFGCTAVFGRPTTLAEDVTIPEDGLISAEIFAQMKSEHRIARFVGQSDGVSYTWTVFPDQIGEPQTLCLGISVERRSADGIDFRFLSEEVFGFTPELTISLGYKLNSDFATLFELSDGGETEVGRVELTGSDTTDLHLIPKRQTGRYAIRAASPTPTDPPSSTASPPGTVSPPTVDRPEITTRPEATDAAVKTERPVATDSPPRTDTPRPVEPPHTSKPQPEDRPMARCTISIDCFAIFSHLGDLDPAKLDVLPPSGYLLEPTSVTIEEGESVYDLLSRVCRERKIHLEASFTPLYQSVYIEGIGNLYEFDCGACSGWVYRVNGVFLTYSCSLYPLKDGDRIEFRYSYDLGTDVGGGGLGE